MDASTKKIDGTDACKLDNTGERRRLSRVRHDERGNAYVEWVDAPAELVERPKLEIAREPWEMQMEEERKACDPYSNASGSNPKSTGTTTRTNLRQLSEWIKMMRELEERKRGGGGGEE
ncbi:MAG: hypothetical protein HIU85_02590 [Proteobacteria bacterium]|nr:hypothetical protein [Pseudomonadota bacterium]